MDLGAMRAFEHVPVGNDAIGFDKEATTSRQFFTARVIRLYRHRGRLDATYKFGKKILRLDGKGNQQE
jgi:hypothetical protein